MSRDAITRGEQSSIDGMSNTKYQRRTLYGHMVGYSQLAHKCDVMSKRRFAL